MSVVLPLPPAPPRDAHSPFRSRPTTPVSSSASPRSHSPSHSSPQPHHQRMSRPCTPPPHAGVLGSAIGAEVAAGLAEGSGIGISLGPALQPISAPTTPVTPTHSFGTDAVGMERCKSSEAGCGVTMSTSRPVSRSASRDRDSRRREPTASSLLLHTYPSRSSTPSPSTPMGRDNSGGVVDVGSHLHLPDAVATPPRPAAVVQVQERDDDAMDVDMDFGVEEIAPVPTEEAVRQKQELQEEQAPTVWGMSRWGMECEEIKPGIRLLDLEKLPEVIQEHNMLDVPSHVLFPWLHGINDDGQKGRDMAAFFGRYPPFEPPSYRGMTLVLAPEHPLNSVPYQNEPAKPQIATQTSATPRSMSSAEPRARSETMSTSSGSYASYASSAETDATSLSVADFHSKSPEHESITEEDVQMHPCESKKMGTSADAPTGPPAPANVGVKEELEMLNQDEPDDGETRAECLLQNASYCMELFDMPEFTKEPPTEPSFFRKIRLPKQINLRNLNIQPIKYATISDLVVYAKGGISAGVVQAAEMMVQAQNALYEERMKEWYADAWIRGVERKGEGLDRPVRYGVWIIREPYAEIEKTVPHLIQLDSRGRRSRYGKPYALFEREVYEAAAMTRASEVAPNFWVGNDMDVPGSEGDGAWLHTRFDVCISASELHEMPVEAAYTRCEKRLAEIREADRVKEAEKARMEKDKEGPASPATIALRNLLSPITAAMDKERTSPVPSGNAKRGASESRDDLAHIPSSKNPRSEGQSENDRQTARNPFATILCPGSSRTCFGQMRNQAMMVDRLCTLVEFLRRIAVGIPVFEGGPARPEHAHKMLVHCHDGYTESTILVLSYIMYTLELTLPEAFLHLQVNCQRSFFLYPADKPLLKRLDAKLQQERRTAKMQAATKAAEEAALAALQQQQAARQGSASPASPNPSRWRNWSFRSSSSNSDKDKDEKDRERRSRKESSESFKSTSSASSTSSTTAVGSLVSISANASGQSTPTQASSGQGAGRRWSRERGDARSRTTSTASSDAKDAKDREAQRKKELEQQQEVKEEVDPKVEQMKTWFLDRRFEGFPSRILPFLYLGNIEHAGNAGMLKAVGITHVVSVGESLLNSPPDHDPMYGAIGANTLGNAAREGSIKVLDLTDIRDDGNDPLRPLIARACKWIEDARKENGVVLVHCRVGVSRSASIVIAYMMQHLKLGLIDAYLTCRARRLNVLIQPNLRFFHELFGWEVELAREEESIIEQRRQEMQATGMVDEDALKMLEEGKRRIDYSWPVFCRDLHYLNRRFLCN